MATKTNNTNKSTTKKSKKKKPSILNKEDKILLKKSYNKCTKWFLNGDYVDGLKQYLKEKEDTSIPIFICYKFNLETLQCVAGLYRDKNCNIAIIEKITGELEESGELSLLKNTGYNKVNTMGTIAFIMDDEWNQYGDAVVSSIKQITKGINSKIKIRREDTELEFKMSKGVKGRQVLYFNEEE